MVTHVNDPFIEVKWFVMRFFARGVPILYYGTEQGLAGHQANVLDRAALKKALATSLALGFMCFRQAGKENKGQAFVRESLWQSRSSARKGYMLAG